MNEVQTKRTPLAYDTPPPLLGEHTDQVLRRLLGKTDEELIALRSRRII